MADKNRNNNPAQGQTRSAQPTPPKKKLSRREKKELLRKQLAYEKQLVKEGKIPLRNQYRPRGFFWRTFAVCLSFIFGIFAAFGGVLGAMGILLAGPSEEVLGYFGLDAEKFLSEAYRNKSVFDLADDVIKDVNQLGDPSTLTLETFSKYSPLVDTYIDLLLENLEGIGVTLDIGELKQQTFGNLASYARDAFLPQIELGPILELDKNVTLERINGNSFLYAIAYGKYGTDYELVPDETSQARAATMTIRMIGNSHPTNILDLVPTLASEPPVNEDGSEKTAMDFIHGIELGSLLGLDIRLPGEDGEDGEGTNVMLYALCYGTEGVDYTFNDDGVLQQVDGGKKPATFGTFLQGDNEEEGTGALTYMKSLALGELLGLNTVESLAKRAENAMVYTLCYGTEGVDWEIDPDTGLIKMLGDSKALTIGELTDGANTMMDTLPLGEMLGLNTEKSLADRANNAMMYTLCYGTEGVDWEVDEDTGRIKMLGDSKATTIGELTGGSNDVVNSLPLGEMLGLNTVESLADRANNAMMYTLCYGTEGEDWEVDPDTGLIRMLGESKAITIGELTGGSNDVVNGLPLGEMLGLNTVDSLADRANNAMMYTLCYGTEGKDWDVDPDTGLIRMLGDKTPTTIGELTGGSNDVVNALPLGEMLGLNTAEKVADRNGDNAMMYALCYGAEGEDYTVNEDGLIEMIDGHSPTTVGDLTENSNAVIDGLYVDAILGIEPDTSAVLRTVAYGNEMKKGDDGEYLTDPATGKYLTEKVKNDAGEDTEQLQYVGGGKYIIETDENGVKSIVMLEDPNNPGTFYKKKTVGDLTAADADLLDGATLGALLEINSDSSNIMQAMQDWTLDDLKDQSKIESLTIGQILEIDDTSSGIMRALQDKTLAQLKEQDTIESLKIGEILDISTDEEAVQPEDVSNIMWALRLKTVGQMKDQSTIDELKLSDILEIDDESSGIMKAMKDWTLADLKNQENIEGLKIGEILDISTDEEAVQPEDVSNIMWALRLKTVGDLKDQNTINALKLSDILEIDDSSSGIMRAMQDWTLADLNDQDRIEGLKIGEILEIDDTSSGIMKAMQDWTLADLNNQEKIESLKIGDIIGIDDNSSGIMKAMQDWTLADLNKQTRIERLKIGQIIDLGDNPSGIMKAMQDWRISDLNNQDKIDSLTLSDIITIGDGSPQILLALANMSLGEISTSIDELTLEDVLGKEAFTDNRILSALRYKQIKELGDAIGALTLEDVFGNEMWSYAKDYSDEQRPSQKVEFDALTVYYYHEDGGQKTTVTEGWYTGDAEKGYTKIGEDEIVVGERYVEHKVYLTCTSVYYEVNYDNLSDDSKTYAGSVSQDEYGNYYYTSTDEEQNEVRVDLERKDTYTREDGGELPEKYRVYTEDGDGETKYYYIEKVPVSLRYAAEGNDTSYGKEDVKVGYRETTTGDEVTAYHAGVWFLLGEGTDGAATKITELGGIVTGVAAKINKLTLNQMYVHELIESEPNVNIEQFHYSTDLDGDGQENPVKNLNELTITQIIDLMNHITSIFQSPLH